MAAGSFSGWGRKLGLPLLAAAALGGLMGDLLTYLASGSILGGHLAFFAPHPQYSFSGYFAVIMAAYAPVQLPIALGEMVVTGIAVRSIGRQRPEVLEALGVVPRAAMALLLALGMVTGIMGVTSEARAATPVPVAMESGARAAKPGMYSGMDERVNEAMAEKAGAPPHAPYINLEERGDVWNTMLLAGGALAGFIIGRWWHLLFGRPKETAGSPAQPTA